MFYLIKKPRVLQAGTWADPSGPASLFYKLLGLSTMQYFIKEKPILQISLCVRKIYQNCVRYTTCNTYASVLNCEQKIHLL